MSWFAVDKDGLAKLLEKRGKVFILHELIQNAWDTGARQVSVELEKLSGRPAARLRVEDDNPDGFTDLTHAYTLFAESEKKDDPTKRGRFNFGEKLVLALCNTASVVSTKGTVTFTSDGKRKKSSACREAGTVFEAEVRMNANEYAEACYEIKKLLPPQGVVTTFNGEELSAPDPVAVFETTLPTVRADAQGNLTRTARKCTVELYRTFNGDKAAIYEMGIPVVETGDLFHTNISQKVPVNLDRNNVPPSYLGKLRAAVLNNTHGILMKGEVEETWVHEAMHHKDVKAAAVTGVIDKKFGTKRAVFDPSDPEANNRLMSEGFKIVYGASFGRSAWDNIRSAGAILPAGTLSPTPRPYSDDPNADPADIVPESKWTAGMRQVVALAKVLGRELLDVEVAVTLVNTSNGFAACYGKGALDFNIRSLGKKWFDLKNNMTAVLDLIIHEFAHHYESNHLDKGYYKALSDLGARMTILAIRRPDIFAA